MKLVIDTDGVADDVRALSIALQHPDVQVVALTAVAGCIGVDQTVANLARTLRANGVDKDQVPIFKGAAQPLVENGHIGENESTFFGRDGLGDLPRDWPPVLPVDDFVANVPGEHAALALVRLFREARQADEQQTLVCLGPLTNLALALQLEPRLAEWPQRVVIMGGNVHGKGNVRSNSTAEFNFSHDPEAAHVVLKRLRCPVTLVPWETFLEESQRASLDFHAHLRLDAPLARFLETVTRGGRELLARRGQQFSYCDEVAMGVAITPELLVLREKRLCGQVELHGHLTRGQLALDWTGGQYQEDHEQHKAHMASAGIQFVVHYDVHQLDKLMFDTIERSRARVAHDDEKEKSSS